jgi:hypothetical protein
MGAATPHAGGAYPLVGPPSASGAVTRCDGAEVWHALMEDAVDRGEIRYLPETTISGYRIPALYWNPQARRHPHGVLRQAQMVLSSLCTCRARLHPECAWPTIQRGEPLDMPDDWREWVRS